MGVTVSLAGDVMVQRELAGCGDVAELLRSGDEAFVNVEVVLSDVDEAADKMICLRAEPRLASEVARLGATVATVANNHALDFGWQGLADTVECLSTSGVRTVGAGRNAEEAARASVLDSGGMRIAFLGFACTLPNGSSAAERRAGIAGIRIHSRFVVDAVTFDETPGMSPFVETTARADDVERAVEAIRSAKAQADAVVVGIHWGVPVGWMADFQGKLAEYQQPLGRALIDAGASVVAGHHPHTLHGIELYRGRPILYSLGNFLFHSLFDDGLDLQRTYPPYRMDSLAAAEGRESVIARAEIQRNGEVSLELVPVWLDEQGEPTLPDERTGRAILARMDELSRELGTRVSPDSGRVS
jgi:poly-gamma-glutamate capsule biosynthesis protein CapA/YwtB (metallophosphatase superfamily)